MAGALAKESHFRSLVGQKDQLYKKLSCDEYGTAFTPLLNCLLPSNYFVNNFYYCKISCISFWIVSKYVLIYCFTEFGMPLTLLAEWYYFMPALL